MKSKLLAVLLLCSTWNLFAQDLKLEAPSTAPDIHGPFAPFDPPPQVTNPPPATEQTFLTQLGTWLTAFDTNSTTFASNRLELSIGLATINNQNTAETFRVGLNLSQAVSLNAEMRNTTALGTVYSFQGGPAYSLIHYDTKVSFGVDGGDSFTDHRWFIAPYLGVKKAISPFAFMGMRLEFPVFIGHPSAGVASTTAPNVVVETGFVY